MTEILRGKDVADRLTEKNVIKADELRKGGMCPTLAIVRLGENPGDLSYERGAMKRAAQTGVDVKQFIYDEAITQDELLAELDKINRDDSIHGVLIFRPMPGHIDEKAVCAALAPEKDVDGITARYLIEIHISAQLAFIVYINTHIYYYLAVSGDIRSDHLRFTHSCNDNIGIVPD